MSKVYTTAVVIIPPKDSWPPIQEIRKQYDRQIRRWMPHITLIYPFKSEQEFDDLEKKFWEFCKEIHSFEITLKNFNYFTHRNQNFTIWLTPEPKDALIILQKKIQLIVPDCDEQNQYRSGFTPHLSVGQIRGKNNLINTLKNLEKNWKQQTFLLEEIYFIARDKDKNSSFQERKVIKLSSNKLV
ncbi:MAG: 2'-5' RNA ligase family protein [Candidatus Hodarchaeota archaeon]